MDEKVSLGNRLLADLQAICPELSALTGSVDNRWFLNFLTARKNLRQLSRLRRHSVLQIKRIGSFYADIIQSWQKEAHFSAEVEWVGEMIHHDARRMLELLEQIAQLNNAIEDLTQRSAMAQRIRSIPGFGIISSAELAGEIGTLERFAGEASLAMYLGMATLDNSSSQTEGARRTRHVNQRTRQAMMAAVARHLREVPQSQTYYSKKRAEGKRYNQAIRSLARHLVRVLWKMLTEDRDYEIRS